ncbi:MAG: LysR family transcriptional regulator [Verrucomicrobiota bacterium]|nr:LysR family transcriptional regulator [Verrucomicrobiota bacterium]
MEIHQLRYFLAVAKTGSFREASFQCHVTQPALSQQIHKLESDLEVALFYRNHRGVTPTPAGRVLVERANGILEQIERAKKAVQIQAASSGEKIEIGAIPTIAPYRLAQALARFRQKFPNPLLIIREEPISRIVRMVEEGELEIGIASLPFDAAGFAMEELFTDELLLAMPVRHPLTLKTVVQVEDLSSQKFILLDDDHCLSGPVRRFFQVHNIRPEVAFKGCQLETVQSFVMAGEGVAFVPAMAQCAGPLEYRPVERGPSRTIIAIQKKHPRSLDAIKMFLSLFREIATARLNPPK